MVYRITDIHLPLDGTMEDLSNLAAKRLGVSPGEVRNLRLCRKSVDEHEIGVAQGVDKEVYDGLVMNFNGECTEVGMYLAMSRQAEREGYPEIAEAFKRYAFEEAEHAAKFAELLGDVVWDTKTNLEKRIEAEAGACEGKLAIATKAKQLNYDAIHDTVHEMAKDEARHGAGFLGLYNRFFKK